MSLSQRRSATRGDLILQPPFFTTSLFVDPFRADIERLIDLFVREHADHPARPFALFKRLWEEQGWNYMHLKIFDARTRHTYLAVACRLFIGVYFLYCMNALNKDRRSLEQIAELAEPIRRLVALFGLYTFYFTQPLDPRIPLYSIRHIDVTLGKFCRILIGLTT
jgi:hypothetical protein